MATRTHHSNRHSGRHAARHPRRPPERRLERRPVRTERRPRVKAVRPEVRSSQRGVGNPQRRLRISLVVIAAILVGIIGRVGYLQTKEADSLRSAGADQWTRSYDLAAQRGTIFDRYGNELAMSVPAASISINPKLIVDGNRGLQGLDAVLDLDDETMAKLSDEIARKERGFVYVRRLVDANVGDFIRDMGHAGVNVDDESRREMPGGDTGRSVLGRTNIDGVGISGL